jgi:hypothetical protein
MPKASKASSEKRDALVITIRVPPNWVPRVERYRAKVGKTSSAVVPNMSRTALGLLDLGLKAEGL